MEENSKTTTNHKITIIYKLRENSNRRQFSIFFTNESNHRTTFDETKFCKNSNLQSIFYFLPVFMREDKESASLRNWLFVFFHANFAHSTRSCCDFFLVLFIFVFILLVVVFYFFLYFMCNKNLLKGKAWKFKF